MNMLSTAPPTDRARQVFLEGLKAQLEAGIPILTALEARFTGELPAHFAKHLRDQLRAGATLAAAFRPLRLLSASNLSVIAASESSGNVPRALGTVIEDLNERRAQRNKLVMALAYPALLLGVSTLILPAPLWYREGFAVYATRAIWGPLMLVVFSVVAFGVVPRLNPDNRFLQQLRQRCTDLPVIGAAIRYRARCRFSQILSLGFSVGMPVSKALGLASAAADLDVFHAATKRLTAAIERGATLTAAMSREAIFDQHYLQVIDTAEAVGTLDKSLAQLAAEDSAIATRRMRVFLFAITTVVLASAFAIISWQIVSGFISVIKEFDASMDQINSMAQ